MVEMDTIVSLAKRRGFIFQSSEIYGGLASTYDYGPLGVELKNNIKAHWWRTFVHQRDDMVGLDSAILMAPQVWVASGHTSAGFADPLVECKNCNQRFRPDQVLVLPLYFPPYGHVSGFTSQELDQKVKDAQSRLPHRQVLPGVSMGPVVNIAPPSGRQPMVLIPNYPSIVPCPFCNVVGQLTEPRLFNLMFKTFYGPVEDEASIGYLRPETAQGIFVNFQNVLNATRRKLPFGIAQIGEAFRNEITVGNFIFRTREFEQMEIEFFVKPGTDEEWHQRWVEECLRWYTDLGLSRDRLRVRQHEPKELAHYAKATYDIEYLFPWGWGEIQGISNRTDFDLKAHSKASGVALSYFDDETQEHLDPYVIEPSAGVDRALLAFLIDAYREEEAPTADGKMEKRVLLKLHHTLAPVTVAVLPLSRNPRLVPKAREVYDLVRKAGLVCQYDDAQSIGRRYRRQDEVGTPLCVTVDFQTVDEDNAVTIRDRDSMQQVRVPVPELAAALKDRLAQA